MGLSLNAVQVQVQVEVHFYAHFNTKVEPVEKARADTRCKEFSAKACNRVHYSNSNTFAIAI